MAILPDGIATPECALHAAEAHDAREIEQLPQRVGTSAMRSAQRHSAGPHRRRGFTIAQMGIAPHQMVVNRHLIEIRVTKGAAAHIVKHLPQGSADDCAPVQLLIEAQELRPAVLGIGITERAQQRIPPQEIRHLHGRKQCMVRRWQVRECGGVLHRVHRTTPEREQTQFPRRPAEGWIAPQRRRKQRLRRCPVVGRERAQAVHQRPHGREVTAPAGREFPELGEILRINLSHYRVGHVERPLAQLRRVARHLGIPDRASGRVVNDEEQRVPVAALDYPAFTPPP